MCHQHCIAVSFYSIILDSSHSITLTETVQNIAKQQQPQEKKGLPLHKLKQLQQSKRSST